jgi:K+-transporting ATPase ATPase C chain
MLRDLRASVIAVVVLTIVFGLAIPAAFTGFAQLAFAHQANSSLIKVNGKVVGSELAAQAFDQPRYFHERPSGTTPPYNAAGPPFANLGPPNPELTTTTAKPALAILKPEGPTTRLTIHDIPVDAVT